VSQLAIKGTKLTFAFSAGWRRLRRSGGAP
jgi:hypothetical protein